MQKTKIEWASMTWNPVTGCYHNCPYCYAERIANRFGSHGEIKTTGRTIGMKAIELYEPPRKPNGSIAPFPYDFVPTFRHYRLDEPIKVRTPQNIFVCSMADLFGEWVDDEWIQAVFEACEKSPQHRYIFLTKNPARYGDLISKGILPLKVNFWYGFSAGNEPDMKRKLACMPWRHGENVRRYENDPHFAYNTFVSLEPLSGGINMGGLGDMVTYPRWIIMGAMTGPGSKEGNKYLYKTDVTGIVKWADKYSIPVFMKDSLLPIVGEGDMRREFPWAE